MLLTASFVLLIQTSLHAVILTMIPFCFLAIYKQMSMIHSIVKKLVRVATPTMR